MRQLKVKHMAKAQCFQRAAAQRHSETGGHNKKLRKREGQREKEKTREREKSKLTLS